MINSLRPGEAYMCRCSGPSLMAWCLFSVKPLLEQITYYQSVTLRNTFQSILQPDWKCVLSGKCIWKCRLQNGDLFVQVVAHYTVNCPVKWDVFLDINRLSNSRIQHVDGLVQNCSNSIANALELLQSCTKPSMSWAMHNATTPISPDMDPPEGIKPYLDKSQPTLSRSVALWVLFTGHTYGDVRINNIAFGHGSGRGDVETTSLRATPNLLNILCYTITLVFPWLDISTPHLQYP